MVETTKGYDFKSCTQNFAFNILAFDDSIYFDMQIKKGSWFGFGFGETMTDCDMVVFECSGEGQVTVTDRWSTGPTYPKLDLKESDYTTFIDS